MDYFGCLVIVVGLMFKFYECGIFKVMVVELFKLFVICKLIECGIVKMVKFVKKFVDCKDFIIWEIFENILKGYLVMFNWVLMLYCFFI